MQERLMIESGPAVQLAGKPDQGTGHDVLLGTLDTGGHVVVKVERIVGALQREYAALMWLGAVRPDLVPRVVTFGNTVLDCRQVMCLVTERCDGIPPDTLDGWRRMGRTLGQLADMGQPAPGVPLIDANNFVTKHRTRLDDLGPQLAPFVRAVPDWEQLTCGTVPAGTALVLAHGDPGPGNYLDNGTGGKLIDWEHAEIAPIGLDLGRLMFIALLGAGPANYVARDHQARACAAAEGYLTMLHGQWSPTREHLRWWLSVAGIQFIHRRWQLDGWPAPWEQAAEVLSSALTRGSELDLFG